MDGRMPVSRRKARSWRISWAVGVLLVASLVGAASLATGDLFLVGSAGVFALAGGWVALRLAWCALVQSRFEHAVDRTELARAYRSLFAERAVEHQVFVADMTARLAQRDKRIRDLQGTLVSVEMRAIEAEKTAASFRRRLTDAEGQVASMEELITTARRAQAQRRAAEEETNKPPLLGRRRSEELRDSVVPEWADMEVDPMSALVAWVEHANQVAGRHSADERPALQA
jgi:hypothetical protein